MQILRVRVVMFRLHPFSRFIDIDKVIGVQEVTASQQDKNHTTFTVQCDARTFQLQAHDEANMRK